MRPYGSGILMRGLADYQMVMEREDYQKRINDLLNAVTTLLDANNAMGEKLQRLEKIADAYEDLKAENEKLKGELAMRKRGHYGKGSEKPKDDSSSDEKTTGKS